jgi:hypothetical protein
LDGAGRRQRGYWRAVVRKTIEQPPTWTMTFMDLGDLNWWGKLPPEFDAWVAAGRPME